MPSPVGLSWALAKLPQTWGLFAEFKLDRILHGLQPLDFARAQLAVAGIQTTVECHFVQVPERSETVGTQRRKEGLQISIVGVAHAVILAVFSVAPLARRNAQPHSRQAHPTLLQWAHRPGSLARSASCSRYRGRSQRGRPK